MESLTNEIEAAAWEEFEKIENMGGAVVAIDKGYMHEAIAKSAHQRQLKIEKKEDFQVGVNCFNGPHELELTTTRTVGDVYDADVLNSAEERQKAKLESMKRERSSQDVAKTLNQLEALAKDPDKNLLPAILDCVTSYCTLQEICDVLRTVFGEAKSPTG
jgi:methylmalonyl-CoA mutase N-terminal domain/subunit